MWVLGTGAAEGRWATFPSPLKRCQPRGTKTPSVGRRMLSGQQRSSRFLVLLAGSGAKPNHPLRSGARLLWEANAALRFIFGQPARRQDFSLQKTLTAPMPEPQVPLAQSRWHRSHRACMAPRMASRRSKGSCAGRAVREESWERRTADAPLEESSVE